jgi:hypothetical protein
VRVGARLVLLVVRSSGTRTPVTQERVT